MALEMFDLSSFLGPIVESPGKSQPRLIFVVFPFRTGCCSTHIEAVLSLDTSYFHIGTKDVGKSRRCKGLVLQRRRSC